MVQLLRQPHHHQISIERVFDAVRPHLQRRYDVEAVVLQHRNAGVVPRARSVLEARTRRGELTHVTGDVHFTGLLLPRGASVLTVHDTEFLARASRVKQLLYSWLWLRLPVARATVVTVPSEATRDDLLDVVGRRYADRVQVVRNPVRDEFRPCTEPRSARSRPVVLLMGTWPTKNLPRSVAALRGLDVRVVVVGPLDADQRALLDASGLEVDARTDLHDDEVVRLYQDADLLLFPSLQEGFGLPVLEAQACGCPVVTSDRVPVRDVAGGAACLVDPEDVASIRAGVLRVLQDADHRRDLVQGGLRNVEGYRPAAVADGYAAVYDQVLSRRRAARRGR